jgi:hypothetical protein
MSIPRPQPLDRALRRCRAAAGGGRWTSLLQLFVFFAGLAGCAGREVAPITADTVRRDRTARAEIEAAIAEDHAALADLIASDRFVEIEDIYADPELRAIALRLVDLTRSLQRLDDTNVLAPGAP